MKYTIAFDSRQVFILVCALMMYIGSKRRSLLTSDLPEDKRSSLRNQLLEASDLYDLIVTIEKEINLQ